MFLLLSVIDSIYIVINAIQKQKCHVTTAGMHVDKSADIICMSYNNNKEDKNKRDVIITLEIELKLLRNLRLANSGAII